MENPYEHGLGDKNMKNSIILTLALGVAMFAQGPGGPGGPGRQAPPTTEIAAYLTLSATQVTQLQDIQAKLRTATQSAATDISTKQQALQTALQKGGSSAAVLGQMLLDIETLRKKITDAQSAANASALLILNTDQKTKLKALDAAAQLAPSIHEANMLNLLVEPVGANAPGAGTRGPGFGPRFRRGPQAPPQQ
jgi:hypothetical protein